LSVKLSLELKGLEKLLASLNAKAEIIADAEDDTRIPNVLTASSEFAVRQYQVGPITTPTEEAQKERNAGETIVKKLAEKIDSV
jgi:hypothetical protein